MSVPPHRSESSADSSRSTDPSPSVDSLARLLREPPDLPVVAALDGIRAAIHPGAALVLTAPPGTGKTTLLPPALAVALAEHSSSSRVLVTQPRRVAVRAATRRIASLLHESVGATVGYSVRGDSRTSADTRIEMVTPGVLLRRLQRDPELPGVGAVVLDEFHERQLDTDLALAFLLDVRTGLRDDLVLALTSATLEAERTRTLIADAIGEEPTRLDVPGVLHPLTVRWAVPPRGSEALGPIGPEGVVGVRREFLAHVARTVTSVLADTTGDLLVFLPGVGEIERVRSLLGRPEDLGSDPVEVLDLHGSLTPAEQDRVLSGPGPHRRIILSTAVAESSLTVPGVHVVVDAALSREPRTDTARGVPMLITVPAARARCEQRAGRAARLGPGLALRCMAEADWARRSSQSLPEIATADLTDAALHCAAWGNPHMSGLVFLDPPPTGSLAAAESRLHDIGAIAEDGRVTPLGRLLSGLPLDPPLGRALVEAAPRIGPARAARFVALLGEEARVPGADLATLARTLERGGGNPALRSRVRDQTRRLTRLVDRNPTPAHRPSPEDPRLSDEDAFALVVALAQPRWIARRRPDTDRYLLADGLGASLPPGSPLTGQEWLAIAEVGHSAGRAEGIIRSAIPLAVENAERAGSTLISKHVDAHFRGGRIRATQVRSLGAITLESRDQRSIPAEDGARIVAEALARDGLDLLPWPPAARSLRERLSALHHALGDPWPDVSDQALLTDPERWLGSALNRVARGAPLSSVGTTSALRSLLPWPEATHFDELAPERLAIPTGVTRVIEWSGPHPTVSLRVQEAFGWTETPTVAGGRLPVVLHLLDPAGRPVAITSDLASFWSGPYHEVRAQLRGRYPRHPWPEDPLTASPTSHAKRRSGR